MRTITASLIAPLMKKTGFRFSKAYRQGETAWHRLVWATVNTVEANLKAGI